MIYCIFVYLSASRQKTEDVTLFPFCDAKTYNSNSWKESMTLKLGGVEALRSVLYMIITKGQVTHNHILEPFA